MKLSEVEPETLTQMVETLIAQGHFDAQISRLIDASVQRRRAVAEIAARRLAKTIKIGDEVKIAPNIKPRYMANRVGKVVSMRHTKLVVEFPFPVGRFGTRVVVPLTTVTLVRPLKKVEDLEVEVEL